MKVEMRPTESVKPYEKNPRHNESAVDAVSESIRLYGFRQPIVVDMDGVIVVGHTRWKAAAKLGLKEVPVHVAEDLTPEKARAYRIADNQTATLASWDVDLLVGELDALKGLGVDLGGLGFPEQELANLMALLPGAALTDPDNVPAPPDAPVTQPGDLYILGNHRLLCGDARRIDDVSSLMGGQLAHLVFTDPPYGVDYDGGTKVRERLEGDTNTSLYTPACEMGFRFSDHQAALYLWHAGVKGIAAAAAAAAAGWEIRCEVVWNKNQAQFGALSAQYKQKHEPCYYCFKKGRAPRWFGPTNEVTVWDCDRSARNEFHPTQKPVALCHRAIGNSSQAGENVLDLFGGSGSTLIACEMMKRHAFLMELDGLYCDVIVRRWEELTGRKAERQAAPGAEPGAAAAPAPTGG